MTATADENGLVELGSIGDLGVQGVEIEDRSDSNVIVDGNPSDWFSVEPPSESISASTALGIPALWQAVSMIAGDIARTPIHVYRRFTRETPDGEVSDKFADRSHPMFRFVNCNVGWVSDDTTAHDFWRQQAATMLLMGNSYAYMEWSNNGRLLSLTPLLPDRTTPVMIKGRKAYITEAGSTTGRPQLVALRADEVLHHKWLSFDGIAGLPIHSTFRLMLSAALAKRKATAKFFKSNMTISGVLVVPAGQKLTTVQKVADGLKEGLVTEIGGFKTLVLRDGYEWRAVGTDLQKAQATESSEHDAREVARIFNLNPTLLGLSGGTSYASEEQHRLSYLSSTLQPHMTAIRSELNLKLRTRDERENDKVYFDYLTDVLDSVDTKTRYEIAQIAIQNSLLTPNEFRAWNNLPAYKGGDQFYRPLNMSAVGAADQQSTQDAQRSVILAAAKRMAEASFERAGTKVKNIFARNRSIEQKDREAIKEIIGDACEVLGLDVNEQLSIICRG